MANLIEDSPNLINETFITYTNISLTTSEFDLVNWAISTNEFTTLKATIGNIISKRANIGWTTPGHTGEDVNLYAYGLIPQNLTGGVMDNTQVCFLFYFFYLFLFVYCFLFFYLFFYYFFYCFY